MAHDLEIVAAVLAHFRGEQSTSDLADMFGVSDAEVHNWIDIFQVAGVVALMSALKHGAVCGGDDGGDPTTTTRPPQHT